MAPEHSLLEGCGGFTRFWVLGFWGFTGRRLQGRFCCSFTKLGVQFWRVPKFNGVYNGFPYLGKLPYQRSECSMRAAAYIIIFDIRQLDDSQAHLPIHTTQKQERQVSHVRNLCKRRKITGNLHLSESQDFKAFNMTKPLAPP